jgi:hypothetical protein
MIDSIDRYKNLRVILQALESPKRRELIEFLGTKKDGSFVRLKDIVSACKPKKVSAELKNEHYWPDISQAMRYLTKIGITEKSNTESKNGKKETSYRLNKEVLQAINVFTNNINEKHLLWEK